MLAQCDQGRQHPEGADRQRGQHEARVAGDGHDHNVRESSLQPQSLRNFVAVQQRQADIQQDNVRWMCE